MGRGEIHEEKDRDARALEQVRPREDDITTLPLPPEGGGSSLWPHRRRPVSRERRPRRLVALWRLGKLTQRSPFLPLNHTVGHEIERRLWKTEDGVSKKPCAGRQAGGWGVGGWDEEGHITTRDRISARGRSLYLCHLLQMWKSLKIFFFF